MNFIKKIILCAFVLILLFNSNLIAQGGWDLVYVPVKSINSSFIGKEIRIDFKSSDKDSINGEVDVFSIRRLLSIKDTFKINLSDKPVVFTEEWKLHVDHGILKEQCLISVGKQPGYKICEIFIRAIDESSLSLDVMVCQPNGEKREEKIVLNRIDIKGVLMRI